MATTTSAALLGDKVTRYESQLNAPSGKATQEMGKQDFLTLFTAQLKNQNPLDPVKNEAFVAQLAQFSQLEATTNMQASLEKFVSSMSNEKLFSSTGLIGRKVSVADSPVPMLQGEGVDFSIDLPNGASGISLQILNAQGSVVRELVAGPQTPGTMNARWDGKDAAGNDLPDGRYSFLANAVVNGANTKISVNNLVPVQSISNQSADGSLNLTLVGGKTIPISQVKQIAY
jgi:flagellar basal-body rod modification protein FlgD